MKGLGIAYERKGVICTGMLNAEREMAVVELVVKNEAPAPCVISSPCVRVLGSFLCP